MADALDLSVSACRNHINELQDDGFAIDYRSTDDKRKRWYLRGEQQEHPITPDVPDGELRSKAAVTKDAKETVHGLIQWLQDDLNGRAPAEPEGGLTLRESHQDMVCHRSDDHIGASYHDEYGNNTFSAEIGIERVRTIADRVFELKARQEAAGVNFDTLHIVLGGDHVHGTGIYDSQPFETEIPVPKQIYTASDIYMEFIDRAVDEFETVQVVCQKGNHGALTGDGMGPDDNVDTAFFMSLDRRVRDRGYDNIRFIRSQGGYYTNFRMRVDEEQDRQRAEALDMDVSDLPPDVQSGHRAHLRHGQKSLEHIGTSAGKKRWYAWNDQHEFDIAYRGHYHEFDISSIASRPVVMSGAIVPPDDFEESLAEWSEPAATVHGTSSSREITFLYPLNFTNN